MKQLGNLAVICAQRPELLMQLRDGLVLVQAKNRASSFHAASIAARSGLGTGEKPCGDGGRMER